MDATFFCALKRKSPKKRSPHGSAGLPPSGYAGTLAALDALEGGFAPLIPIPHGYRSIELVIASEVKQSIFLKKLEKLDCFVTSFLAMTVK